MTTNFIVIACLLAAAHARSISDFIPGISTLSSRIVGGHDAKPGEFPHQVSLQLKWPDREIYNLTHFCGGTILSDRWILTAAHCLLFLEIEKENPDPEAIFLVKAGKHNLSSVESSEQTSLIDSYFIHEDYNLTLRYVPSPYDIGLIKLQTSLRLSQSVAAIGLPERDSEPTGKVVLSGWGAADFESMVGCPEILQTVEMEIVDREICKEAVREVYEKITGKPLPFDFYLVDETNVCSGPTTGGTSACGGDSGGPLISKDSNGKTELVGVVSWGIYPCGTVGAPSVHARTSFFVDWIQNVTSSN